MKVFIAKDWQGSKVFASPPTLSAFSRLWQGHRLPEFDIKDSFIEEEIPNGRYLECNIWWGIVRKANI